MYHLSEYGEHREVSSPRFSPPSPPSGPMWPLSFAIISKGQVTHAFWLVSTHELLKDRLLDDVTINNILLRCRIIQNRKVPLYRVSVQKQITADVKMWSVTHSAVLRVPVFFLFALWPHLCSVTEQKHGNMESICLPFSPYEWLTSNFSLLCRPCIKHESHENRGDDHQLKQLLIV